MNVITLGTRNAFRNTTRAFAIIGILGLSMGLSLIMLVAYQAVDNKIQTTKRSIGNTLTIRPAGYSSFSQANNTFTSSQLGGISKLRHVKSVTETLSDHLNTIGTSQPAGLAIQSSSSNATTSLKSDVTLNQGESNGAKTLSGGGLFLGGGGRLPDNFSPPVNIIGSTIPDSPNSFNGNATSFRITAGKSIDGARDRNTALISTRLANKNKLRVGSTFTAYGSTLTVAGIYDTGTSGGDNNIIVSLPTEQQLSGQGDNITSVAITVDSLENLSAVTTATKHLLGSAADVTSSVDQANQALQPLNGIKNVSLYSLIGSAIVGGAIILMVAVMVVRERRREIGILKAIGASNLRIAFQFMSEAFTLTFLGSIIGVVGGAIGGNPVTSTLVNNGGDASTFPAAGIHNLTNPSIDNLKNIHAAIGWNVPLYGLLGALLITIIGSSFAGWLIAKVRPAEVMRTE